MGKYMMLAAAMVFLPFLYGGAMLLCRESFQEEKNQKRLPLRSVPEVAVLLAAEAAVAGAWKAEVLQEEMLLAEAWQAGMAQGFSPLLFWFLYVMLAAMAVFCMTDYWERIVPNRLLLILLFLFVIMVGLQGVRDMEVVLDLLPTILLGFLFCAISFGGGYLFSRGSMGAGDVKLSLVMGLYLTGEYVVGALLYGCMAAAVFSVVQLARKRLSRKDTIPLVPFLYVGLVIRYLVG